ncbi:MAG: hypothetical protein JXP36_18630 [Bacteroidales bacterium]|nr:hypothetical protein [Bacteroidales bacterium]
MRNILYLSITFICVSFNSTFSAQNPITSKLIEFTYLTHPEKLFVSTDREIYSAGDTVWFSSWLLNADDISLEPYEKILYIDIIDNVGNTVSQNLFSIDKGRSKGQVDLSSDLSNGYYQFVAYTNFMKNQGGEFLFRKPIVIQTVLPVVSSEEKHNSTDEGGVSVFSQKETPSKAKKQQTSDIKVSFLPEGGNWVAGIPCRMAFIGDQIGNDSLQFSGTVYDSQNNLITIFKSEFNGKGSFQMIPKQNTQYHAEIVDNFGQTATFSLPQPENQGHTLSIQNKNNDSTLNVIVYSSTQNIGSSDLTLAITQHQRVIIEYKFKPNQKASLVTIPKSALKTGLAQVTLFGADQNPLCERLVFINQHDFLKFNIEAASNSYEPLKVNIHVTDKNNEPVQGKFALSLTKYRNNADTTFSNPNLVQYLYLNSDLPGLESNCNYFFLNDRKSQHQTDLALLTNGWRRFTWKEVLVDSIPKAQFSLEQKFYIAGTVKKQKTGEPIRKAEITFMGIGQGMVAGTATTNDSGRFVFPVDYYNGIMDVTIQTKNDRNKKKDYSIDLQTNLGKITNKQSSNKRMVIDIPSLPVAANTDQNNQKAQIPINTITEDVLITPFDHDSLLNDTADISLNEVKVNAKRILTPQEKMHSFYGPASLSVSKQQLDIIDTTVKWNYGLISVLEKIIPGLVTNNKNGEAHHTGRGCSCKALEEIESYHQSYECYQFTYNGSSHFRLFIYVDGLLCGFTNHAAQIDWARDNLLSMSLSDIESVTFIQHPKNNALMDAYNVSKCFEELYCNPSTAKHILNNCSNGFEPAPEHIISITTKSGLGLNNSRQFKGIAKSKLVGFTLTRVFYSPGNDSLKKTLVNECPTLYWNPEVTTDKEGKASIEFSNRVMNNSYSIAINGMSSNFIPGSFQRTMTYEPNSVKSVVSAFDSLLDITIKTANGESCKYAEINIANGAVVAQTSADAIFTISQRNLQKCDTFKVSVPGFGNRSMTIQELRDKYFVVKVPYQVAPKDTIENLKKLMKLVLRKQVENRPLKAYDINGVFRQLTYCGNNLSGLTDFAFIQRKKEAGNTLDTHLNNIEQVHQFRIQNYNKKVPFELLNQQSDFLPKLDPTNMDLSFMKDELFDRYLLEYKGTQLFNDRESYIITFEPRPDDPLAIYSGLMIIDKATYAIAHIQWSVANKKKKLVSWGGYLAPQKQNPVFTLKSDIHHATYSINEEKWKLKSASQQLNFTYNGTFYSVKNEMVAIQYLEERTKQMRRTIPDRLNGKTTLNEKVLYNPGSWRQNNVLLPDRKTQIQIEGLYENTVYE